MQGSILASQIDEEYKKEKIYKNKKKKSCKNNCKNCKAFEVCVEKNIK